MKSLSARQLNRAVHVAADGAKIGKRVSPHTLRYSFVLHRLEQGVDIRVIQALLDQKKLSHLPRPTLSGATLIKSTSGTSPALR